MLRNRAPPAARLAAQDTTDRINWEDVRLFMEVARCRSFRKASETTAVSSNTLMRRVAMLEKQLGHILLARKASGVALTAEGREVAQVGERLRTEALSLERMAKDGAHALSGKVKVAVTEGIGTFWLIPRLVDFQQRHPDLTVDLVCDMRFADMSSHQADVAVQLERPAESELVVTRLGYLHVMLFASDEYIRMHGTPSRVEDLIDYHFVEQVAPQVPSDMVKTVVPNPFAKHFVSFRANTSTAHAYAISRGAGIGLLPTYARAITRKVRPINVDFRLRRDIWLTYHPKTRNMKRVRAVIDWLREAFDPVRYPWFREEFVPPDQLETNYIKNNVIHLFEGFLERGL
ncbi:MAG: LysR family transcriptional regulator [Hyphomicrobiales bacterium]|nr:LysR family transcriptional regulator [Hyphomicrobiales bacterium]MDE1972494.1 LysR family transcriptional regulator [Hyphomicrobiales bacterium]MDE2283553.1 LysR family transcriptional regulator [Hyphomicrobiales bacterium]